MAKSRSSSWLHSASVSLSSVFIAAACASDGASADYPAEVVGVNASTRIASAKNFTFEAGIVAVLALTNRALDFPRANGRASSTAGAVDQLDHAITKWVDQLPRRKISESVDLVVVDYTPPEAARAAGRPKSGGQNPSIWAAVQRIHMASDAAYPELTLWSGRVIRADVSAFETGVPENRVSDVPKFADATRLQRAKVLRSKIAPFLRLRASGGMKTLGLESATTADPTGLCRKNGRAQMTILTYCDAEVSDPPPCARRPAHFRRARSSERYGRRNALPSSLR